MVLRPLICAFVVMLAVGIPGALRADVASDATLTAQRFATLRSQPQALLAFLAAMPKGGDLHNHADGAVYAEDLLAWAIADNACYVPSTLAIDESCATGSLPLPAAVAATPNLATAIVRALSMETFEPLHESGHDHFFNTFEKFSSVNARHPDRVLAAATSEAARAGVSYVELMTALDLRAVLMAAAETAKTHAFDPNDFAGDDSALDAAFAKLLPVAHDDAIAVEALRRSDLGCAGTTPDAACGVTVRYIQSVLRAMDPAAVFAQTRLAFALAADPATGFVAINYVQPEDAPLAVRDYALHMRIVAYFHRKYPQVAITLHAGEITRAFVAPTALRDHIRSAVEVAGAQRIGHGVDVLGERDAPGLLRELARKHVLVEIALSSNDQILNVRGSAHPLPAYLAAGVPVALVTDDAGVSRSDLTHEFARAVTTYGFTYPQLKTFARNSLQYAFLAGARLWTDDRYVTRVAPCASLASTACAQYRASNPRADAQWELERALSAFEAREAHEVHEAHEAHEAHER